MEIKIKLNNFQYLIVDDYHNGGIYFRAFERGQIGDDSIFHSKYSQKLGISKSNVRKVINALSDIEKLMS